MPIGTSDILLLAGRLLLGGLFVFGGIQHLFAIPAISQAIAARGVPMPKLVLLAGSAFQAGAGLLLILGVLVPFAALGLVVFTLAASVMLMNFWSMQGPAREAAVHGWESNIAIIGGLLIAAAHSL
jgi:putative oxidoreductase